MTRISIRYLAGRLVASYITILIIMTLMFVLLRSMPGNFIASMISPSMTEAQVERLEEQWGLNEPFWKQYLSFMINYHTFNFGWSPQWQEPVIDLVARRLPRTVILFGASYIAGIIVGPLAGMYLGWWRGSRKDQALFSSSLFAYSIPAFWIAWLLIWLLNYHLNLLPSSYMKTQFTESFPLYVQYGVNAWTVMADVLWHIALPLGSIIAIGWVGSMIIMRTNMNNVTDADYVYLARAKGLSERAVMIKHAARTALIPVATGAIIGIVSIMDGSVIIENVFNWPGIGQLIVQGVLNRDHPTTQALFFVFSVMLVIARLVTDVVYTYLDPRIKFGGGS